YLRGLLRHEDDEAGRWLAQLEKLQPDTFQTVEPKARLLKGQGKGEECAALLRAHATRDPAALRRTAALLEELGQGGAAEELYRRWARESGQPGAGLVLAVFLARQGRLGE